jgi:hypothetical protein
LLISPETFYEGYFSDFHRVKHMINEDILKDSKHHEHRLFGEELPEKDRSQFHRYLKTEIRSTYFHAIETLFELIFAFEQREPGKFNENGILKLLTEAKWRKHSNRIKKIAEDEKGMDFFDSEITLSNKRCSFLEYLFYPAIDLHDQEEELKESLIAIKWGLKVLAKDLTNTEEYNHMKHALRIVHSAKSVNIYKTEGFDAQTLKGKEGVEIDTTNSFSYYKKTEYPDEECVVIKSFETERDMTAFCSQLITNMIGLREGWIKKAINKEFDGIPVCFFGLKELKASESKGDRFEFTFKKKIN